MTRRWWLVVGPMVLVLGLSVLPGCGGEGPLPSETPPDVATDTVALHVEGMT